MTTIEMLEPQPRAAWNETNATAPGLELCLDLKWLTRVVLLIISLLIVSGTAANIVSNQVAPSKEHKLAKLMNRFDLAFEPSIPNWYSSMALLACSGLLALLARARSHTTERWHWWILAALFLGLSIDENVRFHEMLHYVLASRFETHGLLYFPWVIPALIFVALVGLSYLPFLTRLPRGTAILFVIAGATYVMGAVGMDMVGGLLVEQYGMESLQHSFAQAGEELLEMLGVLVFAYALLKHIHREVGSIQIVAGKRPAPSPFDVA